MAGLVVKAIRCQAAIKVGVGLTGMHCSSFPLTQFGGGTRKNASSFDVGVGVGRGRGRACRLSFDATKIIIKAYS